MSLVVVLDTGPLGLVTKRRGVSEAEECREWIRQCVVRQASILVPAIAYYEVGRELQRMNNAAGMGRLEAFCVATPERYLPLTDTALRRACRLWALARQQGAPTADPRELDCDVLIAAQTLDYQDTHGAATEEIVVATGNVSHLSRFVRAELWTLIHP